MRILTPLEQNQVCGGILSEITYDYLEPDEQGQMLLNIHVKGDEMDIRSIIRGFNAPEENDPA